MDVECRVDVIEVDGTPGRLSEPAYPQIKVLSYKSHVIYESRVVLVVGDRRYTVDGYELEAAVQKTMK